ncbi:hypothetical protein TNCV_2963231 [Trichonephila clavipes]|nr:hypothetical protein TNCV_2963231 [Trichonephila clavipes]
MEVAECSSRLGRHRAARRYGSAVRFHGRQCTMPSHSSSPNSLLRVRTLNGRIGRHDLRISTHRACMGFSRQTLGSSYLTTSKTIRQLRPALQDERAAMPQQLIDTLTSAAVAGRRRETCLGSRGDRYPPLKHPDVSCRTPITGMFGCSRIALHATFFNQASFLPSDSL